MTPRDALAAALHTVPDETGMVASPDGAVEDADAILTALAAEGWVLVTAQVREAHDVILGLVQQFAGWNAHAGGYSHNCISAMEDAFDWLGWDDPHIESDATCDEPGCRRQRTSGTPSPAGYRSVCGEHYRALQP